MKNIKSIITFFMLLIAYSSGFSQKKENLLNDEIVEKEIASKFRYGINAALAFPSTTEIGGYEADFDFRYKVMDNLNVGGKIGYSFMIKDKGTRGDGANYFYTSTEIISAIVHSDYYFNEYPSSFAPFAGLGLGVYDVSCITIKTGDEVLRNRNFAVEYTFGGLIRAGFEYKRLRLALEYNIIPTTKLYDQYQNTPPTYILDTAPKPNSYLSLRIGYFFGGRAWGDEYR
jgi:hypothetical protein